MQADWQTWVSMAVVATAAVYLTRRWWPAWRGLWTPAAPSAHQACNTSDTNNSSGGSHCGQGCGQCGQSTVQSAKDHRVHITRTP
jgi:hypothetical protein